MKLLLFIYLSRFFFLSLSLSLCLYAVLIQGVDVKLNLGGKRLNSGEALPLPFGIPVVLRVQSCKPSSIDKKTSFGHLRNAMVKEVEPEKVHLKTKARRERSSGTESLHSARHDAWTRHLILVVIPLCQCQPPRRNMTHDIQTREHAERKVSSTWTTASSCGWQVSA